MQLELLPEQEDAQIVGVYGKNPRVTATAELGRRQREASADLLARRCQAILRGEWRDNLEDLRRFVDFVWPEPLTITIAFENDVQPQVLIRNPGRASRYITALRDLIIDGRRVDLDDATITNSSMGEVGIPVKVSALNAEHGIYVRRGQSLHLSIPEWDNSTSPARIAFSIDLAGVRTAELQWSAAHCHESA